MDEASNGERMLRHHTFNMVHANNAQCIDRDGQAPRLVVCKGEGGVAWAHV